MARASPRVRIHVARERTCYSHVQGFDSSLLFALITLALGAVAWRCAARREPRPRPYRALDVDLVLQVRRRQRAGDHLPARPPLVT